MTEEVNRLEGLLLEKESDKLKFKVEDEIHKLYKPSKEEEYNTTKQFLRKEMDVSVEGWKRKTTVIRFQGMGSPDNDS